MTLADAAMAVMAGRIAVGSGSVRRCSPAVMCAAFGLAGSSSLFAEAPDAFCGGWGCLGGGEPTYLCRVESPGRPITAFRVASMHHSCLFTAHGEIAEECWGFTVAAVEWWTDDPAYVIESLTFGFSQPWPPEDVVWRVTTKSLDAAGGREFVEASFDSPVGSGDGPVHGPQAPQQLCWEVGHTCYIVIDGYGGAAGDYVIYVHQPVPRR